MQAPVLHWLIVHWSQRWR